MILQAREDALQGIVKDVEAALSQFSSGKTKYTNLLTDLILQVHASFAIDLNPSSTYSLAAIPQNIWSETLWQGLQLVLVFAREFALN